MGDVIPFQSNGEFLLYYLYERRIEPKPGTPWHLVVTRDFVTFEDRGEALPAGGITDEDFNAYTGSVVRDPDGTWHLFYTGQNPWRLGENGQPLQLVCHATSDDGVTWTKHPERTFGAFPGYDTADWRDPFVFHDVAAGVWRMLIAARHDYGPLRRRGVIAQCESPDLVTWQPSVPFWDPRRYITHECPEVFQWGDWWYLVYSEFSESFTTRYRMARSLAGPWQVPEFDSVDGRAFYASKTVERGGRRFFVGWIASREGDTDDGAWQWAGTISALEARQNADGTLAFRQPPELLASLDAEVLASANNLEGTLSTPDGFEVRLTNEELPPTFAARAEFVIRPGTTECGFIFHASADGDIGYYIRLEPRRNRLVFDRWPRRRIGQAQWQVSGDVPFWAELERPCRLDPGTHTLKLVVDGTVLVAAVDDQVALSARAYDRTHGHFGVFAGEGSVTVRRLALSQRAGSPTHNTAEVIESMEMETR